MLNKLYEQDKDLHVANYVAYGKTADHKLYADEGYKETVTKAEIEDTFVEGPSDDRGGRKLSGACGLWCDRCDHRCDR